MKAIRSLVCLLLPCVAAAQAAPIAFYPADPTAPPPVLPGPLADGSPPPVTTLAAPPDDPDNNLPVPQFEDVLFRVGDSSGSKSERWKMTVTGLGPDDFRSLARPGGAMGTARGRWAMKIRTLRLLVFGALLTNICGNEHDESIRRTMDDPNRENIIELAGHLRGISRYSKDISTDADHIRIRDHLLSLPGHAEYFAELLEKERAELESGGWRGDYDRHRQWYLAETLPHLPSPESVKVLGAYLGDERDVPHNEDPVTRELVRSGKLKIDWSPVPDNARLAASAMGKIGLRDFPGDGVAPSRDLKVLLAQARAWFAPIKSGEKAFSFKGQAVEYRFKPDGTWSTTPIANPPDDTPRPVPRTEPPPPAPPSSPPLAPPPPPPAQPSGLPWPWLGAGALLLIAALARLMFLRGRRAG